MLFLIEACMHSFMMFFRESESETEIIIIHDTEKGWGGVGGARPMEK
jgi:hypothetical protein